MLYVLTFQHRKKTIQFGMCMSGADSARELDTLPKTVYNLRTGMLELLGEITQFNYFPLVLVNKLSY